MATFLSPEPDMDQRGKRLSPALWDALGIIRNRLLDTPPADADLATWPDDVQKRIDALARQAISLHSPDELPSWARDLLKPDGDAVRVVIPDATRWGPMDASRVIRDAHGRFLGSIGEDGVFKPAEGVTHAHVREALALHEAGSETHTALSAYLKQHEPIPGGKYIVRRTSTPHEDIDRNWSGWMGTSAATKADAIDKFLANTSEDYFDPQPYYDEWQAKQGIPAGQRKQWDFDTYDPAFTEWLGEQRGIEARYNPSAKKWVVVDHHGLAGYHVDAHDEESAKTLGKEIADDKEGEYGAGVGVKWEGDSTVGRVRHVADLGDRWHLYQAEDVISEQEKRNREAHGDYGSDVVPSPTNMKHPTS